MAESNEIKKVITVDLGNTTTSLKEYKKHIDELRGSLLQLDETSEEYNAIAQEIADEQNKLNEVMKVGKTTTDAAEGSYNQLVQTMSELKKQWRATSDEAERTELGKQILDINTQLKELDASTGNYQRNVGDYANAFEQAFGKCLDGVKKIDGPIGQLGGTVKNLIPVIKAINSTAITGLSGIKKGIAATGIGLLVVAVGELAAHWKDIVGFLGKAVGLQTDYTKEVELAKNQMDGYLSSLKEANRELNTELQILGLQGKSRSELLQIEIDGLKVQSKEAEKQHQYWANLANNTRSKQLKEQYQANEQAALQEYNRLVIEYQNKEKLRKAYEEKEIQSYIDDAKEEEAARERAKQDAIDKANEIIAEYKKIREKNKGTIPVLSPIPTPTELRDSFEHHKSEVEKQITKLKNFYESQEIDFDLFSDSMTEQEKLDAQYEIERSFLEMRIALNQELLDDELITAKERERLMEETDQLRAELLLKEKKYNADSVKNKRLTEQQKKQYTIDAAMAGLSAIGAALDAAADMEEEGSKKQKDMQIAAATVNTLAGAVGAFLQGMATYPMPYGAIIGAIGAAAATAAGVAQIAKIKSSSKSSGASSSIAAPSMPELNMTEVNPLLDETADINRLETSGLEGDSEKNQEPIKCYVVESDITETQNRVSVVESNATF